MGKHPGRKNSNVRDEKAVSGCVRTVFRLLGYYPWHNVKKMLPYINPKPRKSYKMTTEQIEFHNPRELADDAVTIYSESVNSSRKSSIKGRIKALLRDTVKKSGKVNSIREHELLALKDAAYTNPSNGSTVLNRATNVNMCKDSNEEYMNVLQLFKIDQELFLEVLQNGNPSQHSMTFGTAPSKLEGLEYRPKEVWPVPNQVHELRKTKSENIARLSSMEEFLYRYGLFDGTSNNNNGIMKHLSKSLKVTNEKDFGLLSDARNSSFEVEQEKGILRQVEIEELIDDYECTTNEGVSSISGLDVPFQQDRIENVEYRPNAEDSPTSTSTFESGEDVRGRDAHVIPFGEKENELWDENLFEYVIYVLDVVGYDTMNDQLEASRLMLDEPLERKQYANKEMVMSSTRCNIVFDLIIEALIEIHENCCAYYPKALLPSAENRMDEQVWRFVNDSLGWRPEFDEELDFAMAHDLSRHKSDWSNLRRDVDVLCIALEDWIFHELLGEIIVCFSVIELGLSLL